MSVITLDMLSQWMAEGYGYIANFGSATTPVTFAGAYDADAPDLYIHVPAGTTIIPVSIRVLFEAVGTESTMEIIALASSTGDLTATITGGTLLTAKNLRVDRAGGSLCTVSGGVDAAGITDPNAGNFYEFWREMRPLTDTVATGENDRWPLLFEWSVFQDGPLVAIPGAASIGSSLSVYAASQAGTGFITVGWVEIPTGRLK